MLLITIKLWRSRCNLWQHRLLNFVYSQSPLLGPRNPVQYRLPPQVKSPRSSSLTHLPATDWNSTPTSLVVNMSSSRNPVYSSQNSTKSSTLPLTSRVTSIPGLNLLFKNTPKGLRCQLNLPPSKSIQNLSPACMETRTSSSLKPEKSTPSTKQVQFLPMPLSSVASKGTLPGMIKPSSTDSMKDSVRMSNMV